MLVVPVEEVPGELARLVEWVEGYVVGSGEINVVGGPKRGITIGSCFPKVLLQVEFGDYSGLVRISISSR